MIYAATVATVKRICAARCRNEVLEEYGVLSRASEEAYYECFDECYEWGMKDMAKLRDVPNIVIPDRPGGRFPSPR